MRKLVCLLLLASSSAFAADMPVKASPQGLFYTPAGSGFYAGIGTEAAIAQSNVSGTNLFATSLVGGNLKAAGGAVKGVVGYITGNQTRWYRLEASVAYQNITGSNDTSSVASRWSASQEVDVSVNYLQAVWSAIGNLGVNFPTFTPVLPSNVAVSATPRQYVGAGFREFGIDGTFFGGTGSSWSAAPMIKSGFLWQTLDSTGKPNGGALDAFAWVSFPMRGITVGNAFAANGAPLTFGAGANMGTQYGLGLHYDFGL